MPSPDPTGRGHAVALSIPAAHSGFLRRAFADVRGGLLDDLSVHLEQLADPHRSQAQADAFGRLLAAVENRVCVPDAEMRAGLGELARSVDEANEYERVTVEHAALHGLMDQLDPARIPARREES